MIKHPINASPLKMATVFNSANYSISAGLPRTATLSLDTLVQTTGMNLTLSSNQITLETNKKYLIYFKAGIQNSTEGRAGNINIRKNNVNISQQPFIASTTTDSIIGSSAWQTPMNLAMAIVTASAGDTISFFYTRTAGASYADTVVASATRAFILELS